MQTLLIVPRLLPEVRAGHKRHTIRWRERAISPGPLCYINADDPQDIVNVRVTGVARMPLSSVAEYLGKSDEWPDAVLLEGMREHYPEIRLDSEVEVIHHSAPLGKETDCADLLALLTHLECSLHQQQRHDRNWLEALLHPDFSEITRSGVLVNREETINALSQETNASGLIASDFRLLITGDDSATLIYRTILPDGTRAALRSSCWVLSAKGCWQMMFHQGTPAES